MQDEKIEIIVITGTLAPKRSNVYYGKLLAVCQNFTEHTHFETIPKGGLDFIEAATEHFAKEYFIGQPSKRYILIGHSQGGDIASLLAMQFSDQTLAVITLATPFKGTTWIDPFNMPIRATVEIVSLLSGGRIKLKPRLKRITLPVLPKLPIIGDLSAHSDVSEKLCQHLANQIGGYNTYAFIATGDWAVFPHRSANPTGPNVVNYIVAPKGKYEQIFSVLPEGLVHIDVHAGHTSIVLRSEVLAEISQIIEKTLSYQPA